MGATLLRESPQEQARTIPLVSSNAAENAAVDVAGTDAWRRPAPAPDLRAWCCEMSE
jgi:hypothetical protein